MGRQALAHVPVVECCGPVGTVIETPESDTSVDGEFGGDGKSADGSFHESEDRSTSEEDGKGVDEDAVVTEPPPVR